MMESPKFCKKIDVEGWSIRVLCYVYAVLSEHITKISFGLKIILAMLPGPGHSTYFISMIQNLKKKFARNFTTRGLGIT